MATQTTNYNLVKPADNETADIQVINNNMDIIDTELKNVNNKADGKISHSLATAVNDFLVASGAGQFVKKTLAEVKAILGLGSAAYQDTSAFETPAGAQAKVNAHVTAPDPHPQYAMDSDVTNLSNTVSSHLADYVRQPGYAVTGGTSTAYTITLNPAPSAYVDGMQITIVPHVDCGTSPTLNVNGLGAIPLVKVDGSAFSAGELKANKPYSFVRVGSNFFLRSGIGNNIKSKQSISQSLSFASGETVKTITISPVDINIAFLQAESVCNTVGYPKDCEASIELTDSTTLTVRRYSGSQAQTIKINAEIFEFNNVKSRQAGSAIGGGATTDVNIPISHINSLKSIAHISRYGSAASSGAAYFDFGWRLTDDNLIINTASQNTVWYNIIEFN